MAGSRAVTIGLVPAIRRLPQVVADAIAAGEVVERPASVVKELCENALDAGARRIDVDIEDGGLVRIAVSDDGRGIPADQIELAIARHATSKISAIDDLAALSSLGFRGEALASIAAVADIEIITATAQSVAATRLHARAGEVVEAGAAGRAPGTTVEVRDLFFNTPARLRFLKTARTEAAAAARVVADLALAHPDIAFMCRSAGRTTLRSPGGELRAAAAAVFGGAAAGELLDVAGEGEIRVGGCISEPRAHRGTRSGLVLVVNGRRIHNRALVVAVDDAYRGLIPSGRHAYGVIAVELDPSDVDANVHPAKREVRFRDESSVFAAVQRACWTALQGASAYGGDVAWRPDGGRASLTHTMPVLQLADAALFDENARQAPPAGTAVPSPRPDANDERGDLAGLQSLGQVAGEWMVAWAPGRIVLVDPHAAHEKILYEEILHRWQRGRLDPAASDHVQLLLIPAVLDCDSARMEAYEANAAWLESCGLVLEPFGPAVLRCTAVPAASANADVTRLVLDVLDALGPGGGMSDERRHRVAALIACHSAVRFGDHLADAQQQMLLTRLADTPGGLTCPHGRPTVMVLDDTALRRAFRRPVM